MGRYYGMDRVKNWKLTSEAYDCIVSCKGKKCATVEEAVKAEYEGGKTPDGTPMTDEYIPCYVIGGYDGMKDGDVVMHTNYRQDRAIQLTQAFVCDDYAGERSARPKVTFLGFTRYWYRMGRHPFLTSFLAVYSLFSATYPLVASLCGTGEGTSPAGTNGNTRVTAAG